MYRAVDSGLGLTAEEWSNLKRIEWESFKFVRDSFLGDGETWTNDEELNKKADMEIAKLIRSSLQAYEKNRGPDQRKYFRF